MYQREVGEQDSLHARLDNLLYQLFFKDDVKALRRLKDPVQRERIELIEQLVLTSRKYLLYGNEKKAMRYYLIALKLYTGLPS